MIIKNLFITLILLSSGVLAKSPEFLFAQGNKAYNFGSYQEAITSYELILEAKVHSAELYYNLGNSYYRIGKVGESVFYFEKAKLLKPDSKEIETNLQFAQNMSLDAIEFLPESFINKLTNQIISLFSISIWAKALICLSWTSSLLFVFYLMRTNTVWKRIYFSSFWLLMIGFITLFSITYSKNNIEKKQISGIIFESEINIWGEPNERSEILFVLHEGTKVEVLDSLGSWNKIKIANGSEGWIDSSSIRNLN